MNCLLCKNENVQIIESIRKNDMIRLWSGLDVDVNSEIKTDIVNKYYCPNCKLSFFDPLNAGGDQFYSRLGLWDWYYLHDGKTEYDFIQKFVFEGIKILDVGSGRGELFNRFKVNVDYTGLELSSKAVELAKRDGINVINEDLYIHSQTNKGKYDLVCLFQVLEHLTNPILFIQAIKECLKPGGLLIIAVPNNNGFIKNAVNSALNLPPHHTLHWTEDSLNFLGKTFNFSIEEIKFEELQNVHRDWYINIYLIKQLSNLFGYRKRTVDFNKRFKIISKLTSIIRAIPFLDRLILKDSINKEGNIGHSIIFAYKN